ncbi:MAG: sugar phosphate nucleotidyltransferase [bacterium JZ-2024 1]
MQAIILAGGMGTRLRPLTYSVPKPLIPVLNIPLLTHLLRHLQKNSCDRFILSLCYRAEDIMDYLSEAFEDVSIQSTVEREPRGTAGALKLVQPFVTDSFVIILNGDLFTQIPVSRLVEIHRKHNSAITIALREVEDPTPYGLVVTDRKRRVQRFIEKPADSEISVRTVNAGIYVMDTRVFDLIPPNQNYSLERQLFPLALEKGLPFYAEVFEDYWIDVGTFSSYFKLTKDLLSGRASSPALPATFTQQKSIRVGGGTTIDPTAEIAAYVVIGERSVIEEGAFIDEFSVIGNRALVRKDAHIAESILLDGAIIGERAKIRGSFIGSNVVVEDDAVINYGNIIADSAIIPRGSVLPLPF